MEPSYLVILLSRWQFAITAMYHFLFVPLTLGLSVMLAIMETIYVMTNLPIWKEMTKFWGILFGINFAMGVATGITMEFQFGTNWSYYSQYVGDIFGAPLAIEGLMAFFLEATFIGLFFFGWDKLPKIGHCIVTWLVAIGSSFSALWILIANGWMQNPIGAKFNFQTMRMEVSDFAQVLFNPVAQAKFVHTISAGYVTGAVFVLSISAYYLLRGRNIEIAKRSITVAASFGLLASCSVIVLGDESGYLINVHQKMKIAAIEGMWKTETPPASFNLIAFPDTAKRETTNAVKIPYVLGLIATRSWDEKLKGMDSLVEEAKNTFIPEGVKAYSALMALEKNPTDAAAQADFDKYNSWLGYALLLKEFANDPTKATPAEIDQAAWATVPDSVGLLFWSFRAMVACGFLLVLLFAVGFYLSAKRNLVKRAYLHIAMWSLPLPWIGVEAGWLVAEHGRQPWVVAGMLPTYMGTSSLFLRDSVITLAVFIAFYSILAVVEFYLMRKFIRLGPDGYAKLHNETHA